MSFEWTRPEWLGLAIPLALVAAYYFSRSLSDFPTRQCWFSLAVRLILMLLVVCSLGGLTWLQKSDDLFVIFAIDESRSVGSDGQKTAEELWSRSVAERGRHRVARLRFGKSISDIEFAELVKDRDKESTPSRTEDPATLTSLPKEFDRDGSNIAGALDASAAMIPPGYVPRIVLVSDGNETVGDMLSTANKSRVPIFAFPLPSRLEPEVQVTSINVPAEVQEGAPFFVEVNVQSNHDDEANIEVFRGEHKVLTERKALRSGENRFRFQQSIDRDRLAAYTVRLSGMKQDTLLDNNSDTGLVYASGKPRVLIIESDPTLIRELAYALEDEGILVDVRPPQGMPDRLSDLQNYECLILSNVPATSLSTQQMLVAKTYVQELGGGFIMLGGELSFGLGGYYKSQIEEMLPVRSDFEKEKEKPSLGMVLVIDKSGSMSGEKLEMAKSAAVGAVELLGKRDSIAVLAFDGETYVVSEMQSSSNKARIADDISRIEEGGGTVMYPAMERSFEILQSTSAKIKHVIMLTDGVSEAGDFESLAQQMSAAKITVSTVAIGDGSDVGMLESIARVGKGRFYETNDPQQVPQIFAKETVTASKSAIDEQPFIPQVVRATHALSDIDMEAAPFLLGYVMTRPKPTSEVILATEKGDPLLVWWRYGLGMTAAFTSDAKTRWAAEWMTWPGYGKFWTQVVRQTMRKTDTRGIQTHVQRNSGITTIDVDAVNDLGQFVNGASVELTLIQPDLQQKKLTLTSMAPGRYSHEIETPQRGAYHLELCVKQNETVLYRQSRGLSVGYSDELRLKSTNESLMEQVAIASGGKCRPTSEEIFSDMGQTAVRPTPLWPWLLTLATLLLVLDVALRRVEWSAMR